MERIRHIRETAHTNTGEGETDAERPDIVQRHEYDPATEVSIQQIQVREYLDSFDEETLKEDFL